MSKVLSPPKAMAPVADRTTLRSTSFTQRLRNLLRGMVPQRLVDTRRRRRGLRNLRRNFCYDLDRYVAHSATLRDASRVNLRSLITMDYHRIEKGLSLAEPRPGFGRDVAERLSRDLPRYVESYGSDGTTATAAVAIREYLRFQADQGVDLGQLTDALRRAVDAVERAAAVAKPTACDVPSASTLLRTRDEVHAAAQRDLLPFFESRHSVRDFADKAVPIETIRQAVAMAQRTPSVCNRQAWRVLTFEGQAATEAALACQNGNRGFRHQIQRVLVVTCDLSHFVSTGERNQAWIDGGMFAMSLIYALHSLGLGTCALNWSATRAQDQQLRKTVPIPEEDVVIMMIAVGHLPETFRVAQSPRKPLDEVLVVLDA